MPSKEINNMGKSTNEYESGLYDLILIPEWVLTEINDAPGRTNYVQGLIEMGYPIYCIKEP